MCAHNNFPQLGKMNRSLLWMRCQNVGDVLGGESPAVDVADLESALYYVFMNVFRFCRCLIVR